MTCPTELMLRAACKVLTLEQLKSIGCLEWYLNQLLEDFKDNYGTPEALVVQKEAVRIGAVFTKESYGYSISNIA